MLLSLTEGEPITSSATTPRIKRQTWLQVLFTVGLLALVGISFRQYVLAPRDQTGVPEKLGDIPLVDSTEGGEALRAISTLHGTDISLVDAYIATYAGGERRVMVWVGTAASPQAASELLQRMSQAIGRGEAGFSNPKRVTVTLNYHSHEVTEVEGRGGRHFFYQSREKGERVVWLTIEAPDTLAVLEQAVRTL